MNKSYHFFSVMYEQRLLSSLRHVNRLYNRHRRLISLATARRNSIPQRNHNQGNNSQSGGNTAFLVGSGAAAIVGCVGGLCYYIDPERCKNLYKKYIR